MKRSTKKSLYKIFVSLFVIFYTFLPQSIVIGQVIDEVSQENTAPIEVVQDVIPQENAAPTEEVVPENNITEVKEEIPQEKPLWLVDGNTAVTSNPVELDKEYTAPQNDKVKIIFTKLPDNPSSVKIKEITLTEEEIKVSGAVSDKAYDITADMIDGTFEYDLVLPSVRDGIKVVYAEDRDSILTDLKEVNNEIVNENNSIEIKNLDHFTLFIVTNPGPKLSTAMVNGMPYVSVPPNTSVTVRLQVTTSGSGNDNNWRTTKYKIGSGDWTCVDTGNHTLSGTYTETFPITAPSIVGSYNLSLLAYSEDNCTGLVSNEVTLTDAIKVVTSSPSLTPPTLTENPSDPISLTSVSGVWTSISGGSGYRGIGTNEIRWGTPAGTQKSGLKFTNSGNQSFKTGDTFYLGMLTHMNWPTNSGTAATGAKLQITLNFNRPDIADAVFLYDFSIEETPNSKGNCPIYQRTLTACDDKVTFPNSYGTTVFTIGDIKYTLVIDGFVNAYPTGTAVDAFITEEEKDNSAFLVGHLSSVLVEKPQISLVKKVNDQDVSAAPGPNLYIDDPVSWKYIVQNTGNVTLTNISVTDNPSVAITCPGTSLSAGATMECSASGTVIGGPFTNTATVTGKTPSDTTVTATDSSWYTGIPKKGHLIVQKTTIPSGDSTSFTINATGNGTITGEGTGTVTDFTDKDYEVTPGTYSVSETVPAGWSLTSNDCTNINVAAGETKYCTITNTKNGSITIIKDAQPTSSYSFGFATTGTSLPTTFSLTDDGSTSGNETKTFTDLLPGEYTVTENSNSDWALTSLSCSDPSGDSTGDITNRKASIKLSAGENVTCTFTNIMYGSISVQKNVDLNGDGDFTDTGETNATDWTWKLNNDSGHQTNTSIGHLLPGSYTISEVQKDGYHVNSLKCGWNDYGAVETHDVTLVAGQQLYCTFTNTRDTGTIELKKVWSGTGGQTTLNIGTTSGGTDIANVQTGTNGSTPLTTGQQTVPTSTYYLSETDGLDNYTKSPLVCFNDANNNGSQDTGESSVTVGTNDSVDVKKGDHVICSYTNTRQQGTIIVKKVMVGGTGEFTFTGTPSGTIDTDGGTLSATVDTGQYSTTESTLAGWELTSISCDDESSSIPSTWNLSTRKATFNVENNETVTCTFTNILLPKLTVTKTVINHGLSYSTDNFGPYKVGETAVTLDQATTFDPGTYIVSENANSNYTAKFGGACDSSGSVTLEAGDNKTCTITNEEKLTHLTLVKEVTNDDGGQALATAWTLTATGPTTISGKTGDTSITNAIVNSGTYTLSESGGPSGYTEGNWSCTGGLLSGNQITLSSGQSVTCTITNDDIAPTLTLIKEVINNNGGTATNSDWVLYADGSDRPFYNWGPKVGPYTVKAGVEYTLTETNKPGYSASSWVCTGGGTLVGNKITLALNENVTCTITNDDQQAYITVVKNVINDNGGSASADDFKLTLGSNSVSSGVAVAVNPGTYTAGETLLPGYTFVGFSGDCNTDGEITVALGESKTCTLTNNDQPGSITIKKDVANYQGTYENVYSNAIFGVYLNNDLLTLKNISDKEVNPEVARYIGMNAGDYSLNEVAADGYSFGGCYISGDSTDLYPLSILKSGLRYDPYNPSFKLDNGEDLEIVCKNIEIQPQLTITKNNDSPTEGLLSGSTVLYTIIVNAPSDEEMGLVSAPLETEELPTAEREIPSIGDPSSKGEVQESSNSADQGSSTSKSDLPILPSDISSEQERGEGQVDLNRNKQAETLQEQDPSTITPSDGTGGKYLIKNVKVTDILPKGFEYISGSWTATSSIRGDIKGSITIEPVYNEGLATWNLGDMVEGEVVTLTYTAKINLLNEPGLYKDIAFVQGDSLLAEEGTGDVLGISYNPGYENTDKLSENFIGTKVLVVEPIEEGGEVLGASTTLTLPRTGADTYITLGAIISMILGIFLLLFSKKRKVNILVITFVFAISILTLLKPVQTYALTPAKVSIRLEQPKTGITNREFNITYVALSIPVKPITVQCQYSLDGVNFSNFDESKTTNSGDCKVGQSIVTGSGTYYFKAIASTSDGGAESEIVTVKVADKPSPVTEYSKTKTACIYTLKFKSPTSRVQIFRSDNQKSFYADDTTLITKPYLTVTPNILSTYTDTPADCTKEYYYAVRAVDEYSNVSAIVTDNIVTIIETTAPAQTTQEGSEVAGEKTTTQQEEETPSTGEVAGEETTAQQEEKAETDTKDETKTEEKETEESIWDKYKYLIISVIVVVLGSGIYNYIRRKK